MFFTQNVHLCISRLGHYAKRALHIMSIRQKVLGLTQKYYSKESQDEILPTIKLHVIYPSQQYNLLLYKNYRNHKKKQIMANKKKWFVFVTQNIDKGHVRTS